jgi:hypothetical protein
LRGIRAGKPIPPRIRCFVGQLMQAFRRLPGSDIQAHRIDNRR